MYGEASQAHPLEWSWVDEQLETAGTYWVVAGGHGHPHPRPVWGVWIDRRLHLSIGSTVITRLVERRPAVTVHLDSGVDVVIVEGTFGGWSRDRGTIGRYNHKYDWNYTVGEYGPLTVVVASTVLAWRSAGWAGRDGFQQAGRWRLR
jgi:hypothetical protein